MRRRRFLQGAAGLLAALYTGEALRGLLGGAEAALDLARANSPIGLRSMPVRYLILDELDAYPLDIQDEGDPVELAIKRTATFGRKREVEAMLKALEQVDLEAKRLEVRVRLGTTRGKAGENPGRGP